MAVGECFRSDQELQDERRHEGLASLTGLFPDFLDAWINLGQTHKALGNYRAADAAYREAMKLQPEHPIATKGAAQCA